MKEQHSDFQKISSGQKHFLPRFSSNSEARASELLENLEEHVSRCYMYIDIVLLLQMVNTLGADDCWCDSILVCCELSQQNFAYFFKIS